MSEAVASRDQSTLAVPPHTYPKLSPFQCLGLGFGGAADIGMQYGMKNLANPIFNVIYGVDPVLIGVAFSLPRLWEFLIDPWIGSLSDRTQGTLGRRHPYMIGGIFVAAVTFALVWLVPRGWSPAWTGGWLIFFVLAHFTGYSFFNVAYSALLGEVSTVPEQRVKLSLFRTAFNSIGAFGIGWLYWLCQRDCFSSAAEGIKVVGLGFGLVLLGTGLLPIFVCKENRKYHAVAEKGAEALKGLSAFKEIWKNRPFRGILGAVFCLVLASFLVSSLGFYVSLCYAFGGDTKAIGVYSGIGATLNAVSVIIFCPVVHASVRRWGERATLYAFLGLAMLGYVLTFFAATPAHPYLSIYSGVLCGFGFTAFWVIMPALTGEMGREHEVRTGHSIYGSFYAMFGMAAKIGASVGLLFTGVILNLTGYHASLGAHQSAGTVLAMRVLNAALPALGMGVALMCLHRSLKYSATGTQN